MSSPRIVVPQRSCAAVVACAALADRQFPSNENKRRRVQAGRKALREAATVEVSGRLKEADGVGALRHRLR